MQRQPEFHEQQLACDNNHKTYNKDRTTSRGIMNRVSMLQLGAEVAVEKTVWRILGSDKCQESEGILHAKALWSPCMEETATVIPKQRETGVGAWV